MKTLISSCAGYLSTFFFRSSKLTLQRQKYTDMIKQDIIDRIISDVSIEDVAKMKVYPLLRNKPRRNGHVAHSIKKRRHHSTLIRLRTVGDASVNVGQVEMSSACTVS